MDLAVAVEVGMKELPIVFTAHRETVLSLPSPTHPYSNFAFLF